MIEITIWKSAILKSQKIRSFDILWYKRELIFYVFKEWSAKLIALWFFKIISCSPTLNLLQKSSFMHFIFMDSSLRYRQKHVYNWWVKAKQRSLRDYTMSAGMCGYMCAPIYKNIKKKKKKHGLLSTNERISSVLSLQMKMYISVQVYETPQLGGTQTGTCIINNSKIWGMLHPTLFLINQPRRPSPGQMLDVYCQSTIFTARCSSSLYSPQ